MQVCKVVYSNGQEDHVSMGANAATKLLRVANNLETILAIELLNAAQAIEFRRPLKTSSKLEKLFTDYRVVVPSLTEDRVLHNDISATINFIKNYSLNNLITK